MFCRHPNRYCPFTRFSLLLFQIVAEKEVRVCTICYEFLGIKDKEIEEQQLEQEKKQQQLQQLQQQQHESKPGAKAQVINYTVHFLVYY